MPVYAIESASLGIVPASHAPWAAYLVVLRPGANAASAERDVKEAVEDIAFDTPNPQTDVFVDGIDGSGLLVLQTSSTARGSFDVSEALREVARLGDVDSVVLIPQAVMKLVRGGHGMSAAVEWWRQQNAGAIALSGQRGLGLNLNDLRTLDDKADTIESNARIAADNFRALLDDLGNLPFPFFRGAVDETEAQADRAEGALDDLDVDSLVVLSDVAREVSETALEVERAIFSPKGAVVGGLIIAGLVGLGYWWGSKR